MASLSPSSSSLDLESGVNGNPIATAAAELTWTNITVTVTDRNTKQPLNILESATGSARAGEMVALMGPSGSGKSTLLNVLARRPAAGSADVVTGEVLLNGRELRDGEFREISTYVEQEDLLIGSLTVKETIHYAARLSGSAVSRADDLVAAFGLQKQANTIVGTPVKKGISGGQKRRVSVAAQLITAPKILFLDEPTSGLDSAAAYEVMSRIKKVAQAENMIVICSIHQPSTSTFNLFSRLVLLAQGHTIFCGQTEAVTPYFDKNACPLPPMTNPAEFILELVQSDFERQDEDADSCKSDYETLQERLERLKLAWKSEEETSLSKEDTEGGRHHIHPDDAGRFASRVNVTKQTFVLLRRGWLKSYRDPLAYWIRVVMYLGLAVLMSTVWLRLGHSQENIQPFINAIFFSGAFMSFMAVAYIPAYLEDYESYRKERANGLYGPTAFMLSNFILGIPFIFLNTLLFSIITVFMVNFQHSSATPFFKYVMWLFLDLLAAESLVVLIASLIPIFVAALAVTAFANGLWMSVGGFLVSQRVLNTFWYHTFYWINYQRYTFQGMMFNEFENQVYACEKLGEGYQCMYPPTPGKEGLIEGESVLASLGYNDKKEGLWIGLMIAITFALRFLAWLTLRLKKN